jgi:hypothetical protein
MLAGVRWFLAARPAMFSAARERRYSLEQAGRGREPAARVGCHRPRAGMNRHPLKPEPVREFQDRRNDQPAHSFIPLTRDDIDALHVAGCPLRSLRRGHARNDRQPRHADDLAAATGHDAPVRRRMPPRPAHEGGYEPVARRPGRLVILLDPLPPEPGHRAELVVSRLPDNDIVHEPILTRLSPPAHRGRPGCLPEAGHRMPGRERAAAQPAPASLPKPQPARSGLHTKPRPQQVTTVP